VHATPSTFEIALTALLKKPDANVRAPSKAQKQPGTGSVKKRYSIIAMTRTYRSHEDGVRRIHTVWASLFWAQALLSTKTDCAKGRAENEQM
jgi:hypothetical protein